MAMVERQIPVLSKAPPKKMRQVTMGRQSVVGGVGLSGGVAGVVSIVSVKTKDTKGNYRTTGGDIVLCSITPEHGQKTDAHVIDNTDGSYTCTYLPTVASANCKVVVTVNGTHVLGSPFAASVAPGPTNARKSEVIGRGLFDGVSGQESTFTIVTHDIFGNRCTQPGDKFCVTVKPLQSLLPELQTFLRKYEVSVSVQDNEDGTHAGSFTVEYAGFYALEVTLGNVPVGTSPYTTCVCNSTIAFPPELRFEPLDGDAELAPPAGEAAPPSRDVIQIMDQVIALKSEPIEQTGGRPTREYVHSYTLKAAMGADGAKWKRGTIRSQLPQLLPPPYRRTCLALDTKLLALCHADPPPPPPAEDDEDEEEEGGSGLSGITELRTLDLDNLVPQLPGWEVVSVDGRPPNAIEGYAAAVWEGKSTVLVSGGIDAKGRPTSDVWMLSLGGANASVATWRVLAEWPMSNFGGESPCERCNHTLTFLPETSKFWIFGGRNGEGELLADLYNFDMAEESWSCPTMLGGEVPVAREFHASCFVAERYLVVMGGVGADGKLIEGASVYDVFTAQWSDVSGVPARAHHRLVNRNGVLYCLGGIDAEGKPAPSIPLRAACFGFAQTSSFDFVGNPSQAIVVKSSPSLQTLKNLFTVEAVVYIRSLPGPNYTPIVAMCDSGLKKGFGLFGQEHPAFKGDAESGPWLHFFVGQWMNGGSQMAMCPVELETWMHVAATYDGKDIKIYINSQLRETASGGGGGLASQTETINPRSFPMSEEEAEAIQTRGDVFIGGYPGKYAFDGLIDEVRLWEECKMDEDFKARLNTPHTDPNTPGLLFQYTFNEGSGETIIDSSGSRNHATFDRYAGGVELRRVQSKRPKLEWLKTAREAHIEANFEKVQAFKHDFENRNGRPPTMAEMAMADKEIADMARRLGDFGMDAGVPEDL